MISLFVYGLLGTTLITGFFYLDGHNIVNNNVIVKWKKFRKINKLVATNYTGFFNIVWISLCMVAQALWISFIQYINSSVVQTKDGRYTVTYVIKGKTYKMVVKPVRGPHKVMLVYDGNQEDVSHLIFQYLGPEENFHGKIYTPGFFEIDELVFELSDGTEKIFSKDDDIVLI